MSSSRLLAGISAQRQGRGSADAFQQQIGSVGRPVGVAGLDLFAIEQVEWQ